MELTLTLRHDAHLCPHDQDFSFYNIYPVSVTLVSLNWKEITKRSQCPSKEYIRLLGTLSKLLHRTTLVRKTQPQNQAASPSITRQQGCPRLLQSPSKHVSRQLHPSVEPKSDVCTAVGMEAGKVGGGFYSWRKSHSPGSHQKVERVWRRLWLSMKDRRIP